MVGDRSKATGKAGPSANAAASGFLQPSPIKRPWQRSGTYLHSGDFVLATGTKEQRFRTAGVPGTRGAAHRPINPWFGREEVRLDIDGGSPQMAISGTGWNSFILLSHWVALLTPTGPESFDGTLIYPPPENYPGYCGFKVLSGGDPASGDPTLELEFTTLYGVYTRSYVYQSPYFHKLDLECDHVAGTTPTLSYQTLAHPNHPPKLLNQIIDLETVFETAGFDVTMSGATSEVPAEVGPDAPWDDDELHAAMETYWSHHADKPQWALWLLFAAHHVDPALGGVMFDHKDGYQRQGAAVFSDSFIADPPAGDPDPAVWVDRSRFYCAIHELGHCLNLAHSWEKGDIHHQDFWIPNAASPDGPTALSFMNVPQIHPDGQGLYYKQFRFGFSASELLFLRHAPPRFVQSGGDAFMSNFAFAKAAAANSSDLELRFSVSAPKGRFDYLTPPVIEAALINQGTQPLTVSASRLADQSDLVLMIGADDGPARRWQPYVRHCRLDDRRVLAPGEALYDSLVVGAGGNGWYMTRPGRYRIQAVLKVGHQLVYSNELTIIVEAPASRVEERLAVDFFTPEVARALGVNGSRGSDFVDSVLARALELKDNSVSKLAAMMLALPLSHDFKMLEFLGEKTSRAAPGKRFATYKADPAAARKLLAQATQSGVEGLIDAMGHARYLRAAPLLAGLVDGSNRGGSRNRRRFDPIAAAGMAAVLPVERGFAEMLAAKSKGLMR